MPRSKQNKSCNSKKKENEVRHKSVANVNSNHSADANLQKQRQNIEITNKRSMRNSSKIKSKVSLPVKEAANEIVFEEDGETVNMEIDDGGAAAAEFASDDEEPNSFVDGESQTEN